jgi:hypothetical protein
VQHVIGHGAVSKTASAGRQYSPCLSPDRYSLSPFIGNESIPARGPLIFHKGCTAPLTNSIPRCGRSCMELNCSRKAFGGGGHEAKRWKFCFERNPPGPRQAISFRSDGAHPVCQSRLSMVLVSLRGGPSSLSAVRTNDRVMNLSTIPTMVLYFAGRFPPLFLDWKFIVYYPSL